MLPKLSSAYFFFRPTESDGMRPNLGVGFLRRKKKNVASIMDPDVDQQYVFLRFKALLMSVKAFKQNAEQHDFTKIFGRELLVSGRALHLRVDVLSEHDQPYADIELPRDSRTGVFHAHEKEPVFYTHNFEVNFSVKEQQTARRRSTLTRHTDKSKRNSLYIDIFFSLEKITYRLNFSVVKLIDQIYRSVHRIHSEFDWNRFLQQTQASSKQQSEVFTKRQSSFDLANQSAQKTAAGASEVGQKEGEGEEEEDEDEGDDCWRFVFEKSDQGRLDDICFFEEEGGGDQDNDKPQEKHNKGEYSQRT